MHLENKLSPMSQQGEPSCRLKPIYVGAQWTHYDTADVILFSEWTGSDGQQFAITLTYVELIQV